MNIADPNDVIRTQPMSRAQIRAVAVGATISAVDGYDILSISLAAPGLANAWGIDRSTLGVVLAMEVIGAAVGAILLGRMADLAGRRMMLLGGQAVMMIGMALSAIAPDVTVLACCRFFTGIGIGSMVPALASMVTEVANERRRDLAVSLLGFGYSIGAILSGALAAYLLLYLPWPSVFVLGSLLTAAAFMLTFLWVPETIVFLSRKRPPGALARINAVRSRFGHAPVASLPAFQENARASRLADLFAPNLVRNTLFVTTAYFFMMATSVSVVKWIPKIAADMGNSAAAGASVLVFVNVGGLVGTLAVVPLAKRYGLNRVCISAMFLSAAVIALLGQSFGSLTSLMLAGAATGTINATAGSGLYILMARAYPSHLRATGIGFTVAFGRAGPALGPMLAGILLGAGLAVPMVMLVIGLGAVIAALLVSLTRADN
ncbi:MAG TPA: MFS transporter [Allosphingosinicella sp.]|nr:MFS transporter [Allosphingosinicella sp.]